MEFYILQKNAKQGPYSIDELRKLDISHNTMVWSRGFVNWREAKNVPELSEILSMLPPDAPMNHIMPKTWLVESILVTCFCCLPFGIVGIINATKIESLFLNGDYEQALAKSSEAKKWTLWGFFLSLIGFGVYILVLLILYLISHKY